MTDKYILDGHKTVRTDDLLAWGRWFETAQRHVAIHAGKRFRISTVFLGIDHAFGGGVPQLFETMVFSADNESRDCERYATWDEAEAGHVAMVKKWEGHLDS